jgi:hypothetical protein
MRQNLVAESLSSAEADSLKADIAGTDTTYRFLAVAFPASLVLLYISWQDNPFDVFSLTSFAICFTAGIGLSVSILRTQRVRMDLKTNEKMVGTFLLQKKIIEDHIKTNGKKIKVEFTIDDKVIEQAIQYRSEKENIAATSEIPSDSLLDKILQHKYLLLVSDANTDVKDEFNVPIECFVKAQRADLIQISFAKHSRKVFNVKRVPIPVL